MMKRFNFLLIVLLIAAASHAQGVDSMLKVYAESFPQQKAYVHFDKNIYRAGESIWFKAYIFAGYAPAYNSKNFYAELMDASGKVVQRKVYPIVEGSAAGYFDIADNAPPGATSFRGYTTWMLNFDTAFLFQKDLTILSKEGNAETAKASVDTSVNSIGFFPEGGNLVAGLESVVAFKANDNRGWPVNVTGSIIDSKNNVITTFKSVHDGMGKLLFTPADDQNYFAIWKDDKGKEQTASLPKAQLQGIILSTSTIGDKLLFVVKRSPELLPQTSVVNLVATFAQERVYKAKIALESTTMTSGAIPLKMLPSGVLQVTLFSSDWQPLAERMVLVNNNNYSLPVSVTTPEVNVEKRARNVVEIDVTDTLLSNMSLSITDAALGAPVFDDNIISRMLLTGDIRGYVHQPSYYFSNNSDSVASHLDLVMMTHGWRRFRWSDVVKNKVPVLKYPQDEYLALQVKVFGLNGNRLKDDEMIFAFLEKKDSTKSMVQIPRVGPDRFELKNVIFFDTVKVFFSLMRDKSLERTASILFENNFYKGVKQINMRNRPVTLPPTLVSLDRSKILAQQLSKFNTEWAAKGNVLQSVTVRTKARSKLEEMDQKYASGMFAGGDSYSFDMVNDPFAAGAIDIFSFLQGRVPGLQIQNGGMGDGATVTWRGSNTTLFLNEMQVDASMLAGTPVSDIAYVKVLRPPFFGATGGGPGGAIAIYTKKGSDVKTEPGKGLSRSVVGGYSSYKEFYSPNYSNRSGSTDVVADYRSTLYWSPRVLLDATRKKMKVEFYNNDISQAFRIVLEGVNEVGKLVHIEKIVQP
jgi:hypothetical protein